MTERVVNTYNVFVDSSTGRDNNSKGDNYHLHLGNAGINCDAGQYLRLNLNQFTMHKNFTDVNATNNNFRVRVANPTAGFGIAFGFLSLRNNTTLNALASDFASNLGGAIRSAQGLANTVTVTASNITPSSTTSIGGDSDHIISFDLTFSSAHNITDAGGSNPCLVQCFTTNGECYELLGGDRIDDPTDTTTSSISISATSTTVLAVQCLYPAQRHTLSYVYLRAGGLPNTSLESISLANDDENHRTDTIDSDILARIPVDVEYCNFDAQVGREYFINVKQKQINVLNLRLTDSRNRPLCRAFNSHINTAAGTGSNQSTLGNLSFSAVLRIDVIQQRDIKELSTAPVKQETASRFENLLVQPKFGRDGYGSGVGK